jgi:hypothetical protein
MNVIQVIVINLLVTYQEVPTNKFRVRVNHDHDDYCHSELQPGSAAGGPGPGRARLRQLTVPVTDGHGACDSGLKLAVDTMIIQVHWQRQVTVARSESSDPGRASVSHGQCTTY